jgi:hypothetical protein
MVKDLAFATWIVKQKSLHEQRTRKTQLI